MIRELQGHRGGQSQHSHVQTPPKKRELKVQDGYFSQYRQKTPDTPDFARLSPDGSPQAEGRTESEGAQTTGSTNLQNTNSNNTCQTTPDFLRTPSPLRKNLNSPIPQKLKNSKNNNANNNNCNNNSDVRSRLNELAELARNSPVPDSPLVSLGEAPENSSPIFSIEKPQKQDEILTQKEGEKSQEEVDIDTVRVPKSAEKFSPLLVSPVDIAESPVIASGTGSPGVANLFEEKTCSGIKNHLMELLGKAETRIQDKNHDGGNKLNNGGEVSDDDRGVNDGSIASIADLNRSKNGNEANMTAGSAASPLRPISIGSPLRPSPSGSEARSANSNDSFFRKLDASPEGSDSFLDARSGEGKDRINIIRGDSAGDVGKISNSLHIEVTEKVGQKKSFESNLEDVKEEDEGQEPERVEECILKDE
jgi:hypothetical protein